MMQTPAKHLVIAGVTRAATTSLFTYLADHPSVCRSTIKETRFFMDHDELKRLYRYEDDPALYDRYFPDCPPDAVRLEATPDYLYRSAVAARIADSLPNVHLVIILREPIARLISWRRYAIQNGLLDADMTLSEYVRVQFEAEASGQSLPQHMRSLQEGRYARYLGPWVEAFGRDRLSVTNYRDLMNDPAGVTRGICEKIRIDAGFFDHYPFDVHNASRRVRWPSLHAPYRSLIWRIKPMVHDKPVIRSVLRGLRRTTDTILGRTGQDGGGADPGDVLSEEDRRRLEAYYQDEPAELARRLGLSDWVW